MVAYTQIFNELALMCLRMVEPKSVKVDDYIRGLSYNIKGKVTSSRPANLNEVVRMAHNLMEQKVQTRNERIFEGNKRKWENFQSGNSSKMDNSRQSSQNNQKQGNAQAMTTAPNKGKVSSGSHPVCKRCFTRHVGQCTIKCYKCGKVGHKERYWKENNVATCANDQPVWTCYDCAYAIKDAETQGPNMVTGTFLLINRYDSILFDSGSDRSFVDTRFSFMLDIDSVKIAPASFFISQPAKSGNHESNADLDDLNVGGTCRYENSLGLITKMFVSLIQEDKDDDLDLNKAATMLDVKLRKYGLFKIMITGSHQYRVGMMLYMF
nr:hypothetical protein [Tanacetum cinerariifolium]